jgi:hypothetical protein
MTFIIFRNVKILTTTTADVSVNISNNNVEIMMVLCHIYIVVLYTFKNISSVCPKNTLHNLCHLATELVTILKQIRQEI